MAAEARPVRLPLDTASTRAAIESGVQLLVSLMAGGRATDERVAAHRQALRTLRLDIEGADFDARFPVSAPRTGEVEP